MIHVCLSPSDYWCPEGRRSCLFAHRLFFMRAQDIEMSTFEFGGITTWQSPGRECGGGVWGLPEVPLFWVRGLLRVNEHVLNSSSKTICGKGAPTPPGTPPPPTAQPTSIHAELDRSTSGPSSFDGLVWGYGKEGRWGPPGPRRVRASGDSMAYKCHPDEFI